MLQADNWPLGSRLKRESAHVRGKSTVLIDTIQRFKSLESPIVILWGLDSIDLSQRQQELLNVESREVTAGHCGSGCHVLHVQGS